MSALAAPGGHAGRLCRRLLVPCALMVTGALALIAAFSGTPALALAPAKTGWWFQLKTNSLPIPVAVPTVPDGGLFVQQGPNGPMAYGALSYAAGAGESASLTLTAATGSTTLQSSIQACPITGQWSEPSPSPGAWESKPGYGLPCTFGRVSSDGKYLAFFFDAQFLKAGVLDVAIVPVATATPFAVAFDKPAADSLKVTGAPPPTFPRPAITSPPQRPAAGPVPGGTGAVPAPVRSGPAPQVSAPPVTTTPATELRNTASPVLSAIGLGDPDRLQRALALGGTAAIVIGWWLATSRLAPAPRPLGALATRPASDDSERRGGIGRFVRVRSGPPRRLR